MTDCMIEPYLNLNYGWPRHNCLSMACELLKVDGSRYLRKRTLATAMYQARQDFEARDLMSGQAVHMFLQRCGLPFRLNVFLPDSILYVVDEEFPGGVGVAFSAKDKRIYAWDFDDKLVLYKPRTIVGSWPYRNTPLPA